MVNRKLIIAVDFDGTIVEERYPKIGEPLPNAFEVMTQLQNDGHRLLLWTYRHGKELQEAIDFCKTKGIEFYAANRNFPEEEVNEEIPRKILADIYIDDRTIEGRPDWLKVYEYVYGETPDLPSKHKKKGFGWWLF